MYYCTHCQQMVDEEFEGLNELGDDWVCDECLKEATDS